MKTMMLATAVLIALSGVSGATGDPDDESAFTLELSGANAENVHDYFLKCSNGKDITSTGCGVLSVWENTNGKRGLQTRPGSWVDIDRELGP